MAFELPETSSVAIPSGNPKSETCRLSSIEKFLLTLPVEKDSQGQMLHSDDELTHLFTNGAHGGGFRIESADESKFLEAYAQDLKFRVVSFVFERRTRYFKFHMQFAIHAWHHIIETDMLVLYASELKRVLVSLYPTYDKSSSLFNMICCGPPNSYDEYLRNAKIGFIDNHIYIAVPNLIVDATQFTIIRNLFVTHLVHELGECYGFQKPWSEQIKPLSTGLLMLESRNASLTSPCRCGGTGDGAVAAVCSICGGTGSVTHPASAEYFQFKLAIKSINPESPEYTKAWTSAHDTIVEVDKKMTTQITENPISAVTLCSIRSTQSESTVGFQPHGRPYLPTPPNALAPPHAIDPRAISIMTTEPQLPKQLGKNLEKLRENDERVESIKDVFKSKLMPAVWNSLTVHCVKKNSKGYVINVRGNGQHYCKIVKRHHISSDIYFVIDAKDMKMMQKCFCKKGDCVENSHPTIDEFPFKMKVLLFPEKKNLMDSRPKDFDSALNDKDEELLNTIGKLIDKLDASRAVYLEEREKKRANHAKGLPKIQLTTTTTSNPNHAKGLPRTQLTTTGQQQPMQHAWPTDHQDYHHPKRIRDS